MASDSTVASKRTPKTLFIQIGNGKLRPYEDHKADTKQRNKVYNWEDKFINSRIQGFSNISGPRAWIKFACKLYKIKPPKVLPQRKGQDYSWYCTARDAVYMYKRHYNVWSSLHEAAHVITEKKWGITGHGPKFVGVLMYLLSRVGFAPTTALYASAKAAGVKFVKRGWVDPQVRRKKKKPKKRKR